ncbi:coagulation factor XIII A chain-like isoform X3 [Erpetoichthys calabaricus]|uniref:protein-glutamine gamma-glutamyltransferase n=2 Tax=Erpetoichthys calabaricus TaxID=27687 RepID=A0A8C4RJR4_ERPCA|nr:coagulation factor XIII A chain-like isoform X1 [Erpetoichthys calabaricus]XP_051785037.1 coagulation factor XIII A chain-like isoform X2 [Erpetoichthys calabaricus]XP_051785038.1 coagulation factor XIII A chain-like isoform X3 [Erpetoichthys calabaricus]
MTERQKPPPPSHIGRSNVPPIVSNAESDALPEFEAFMLLPRGPPNLKDFLEVINVDMMKKPDESNRQEHHTNLYDSNHLIIRRGQPFQIKITFNRTYKPEKDQFWLEFLIGRYPQVSKGTYIPIMPEQEQEQGKWRSTLLENENKSVTLSLCPNADCIVGKFRMYVAVMTPYGIRRTPKAPERDVYIIFNPWAEDDSVFLSDEEERKEYVLNEYGTIYYGEASNVECRPWNFGQFEYGVLDACLYVMDQAQMPLIGRCDPVKVSRLASAMVNAKDDDGILVGNWSGDYTYGVAPTAWTGSVEILVNYASSRNPVCYGQCWVFAAVFNTFLRCLGIPARVVTNFFSAHDNNGNLKVDVILDDEGKINTYLTKDSIWNYHCWNECWMTRPDLPTGFGGWQVVDATPQETSDGLYRCGPASVQAIKHGQVCFPFDAPFVYAEINSDVVYWKRNKDGTQEAIKVNKQHVGQMVLTKEVGRDAQKNITDLYKFKEGSEEERLSVETALTYGLNRQTVQMEANDVDMEVRLQDAILIGSDFKLSLEFRNRSRERRTMSIYVNGNIVIYTGVTSKEFKSQTLKVSLEAQHTRVVDVSIQSKDYINHLVEQAMLHFIITGRVNETAQILTEQKVISFQIPKLTVKTTGMPRVNEEMSVTVEFKNPLQKNLVNVSLRLEGPGLMKTKVKMYSLIPPNTPLTWTEYFAPTKPGRRKLIACLDSEALRQVYGETEVNVIV